MRSSESGAAATVIGASAAYFGLVFAVGFGLGTVRALVAVPVLGERAAELLETPLMLTASFLAARWVVRRYRISPGARRLTVGLVALAMLSLAEIAVVPQLRGISLEEYVAGRDPVSGTVYLVSLALFALMPWAVRAPQADSVEPTGR